jgi:anaerobic selenocysteine-containing dehydrogenase
LNAQLLFLGSPMDVLLNPVDAAAVGVQDGEQVVVRSGRGEIVGVARVDESVRRGVVSVPHGHEHANVNYLTDIRKLDPLTGMALYSGFPVTVRPVSDRSSPAGNQAR